MTGSYRDTEEEEEAGRKEAMLKTLERILGYEPVENDPAELGLNAAQQLRLEEVLTQAIGAPVAGAHAAETDVAAERHRDAWV